MRIEAALARGCEYDDLAQSITETGVKISTATLKQYHTEYRRSLEKRVEEIPENIDSVLPPEQPVQKEKRSRIETKTKDKSSHSSSECYEEFWRTWELLQDNVSQILVRNLGRCEEWESFDKFITTE